MYSPWEVSILQCRSPSSQRAATSSCPNRMCGRTPKRSAVSRRYAYSSSREANVDFQFGFRAKENEYRWDMTSHAQPG